MTRQRACERLDFASARNVKGNSVTLFHLWRKTCRVFSLCVALAIAASAQTVTTLVSFDGADGAYPVLAVPTQGTDGNLYGVTTAGGANGGGTVFSMTSGGALTTLYSFCAQTNCADGTQPYGTLIQGADGNFYGTTYGGGLNGGGTIFKITSLGALTMLYSFCALTNCADGSQPFAGIIQVSSGNFYGTTFGGGVNGYGTVFKITTGGSLTTLHSFNLTDGRLPYAALIQATDGNLYGTTFLGGPSDQGTVFKMTSVGTLTTLYTFCAKTSCADGNGPFGGLVQATNGSFYGTTSGGGANNQGTVFEITSRGALKTLHSFRVAEGIQPHDAPVQATDGNFYGTTTGGGKHTLGTLFKITPTGTLTPLFSFGSINGAEAFAGMVQATDGNLYGTTYRGGAVHTNDGTVFSLSVGLVPFVKTLPTSGKVGAPVEVLGNSLTSATNVTFNGTAATFTVVSDSEITTTVPIGATNGTVQVTTPGGTLLSNVVFRVKP